MIEWGARQLTEMKALSKWKAVAFMKCQNNGESV